MAGVLAARKGSIPSSDGKAWRTYSQLTRLVLLLFACVYVVDTIIKIYESTQCAGAATLSAPSQTESQVDPEFVSADCADLPSIRRTGMFFAHADKVDIATSPDGVTPRFHIGSQVQGVSNHMIGDAAHFDLISEHLARTDGTCTDCVSFDIGANQGFFTYYLASLGVAVHAFEINEANFESLQHGLLYNPNEVADRVHLYPMGLSDQIGRSGQKGREYEGFLKRAEKMDVTAGPILAVTFDCFAHHVKPNLQKVYFVKVDVEGFEIAVLKGAQHSLLDPSVKIGAWLMEVGPARWMRADVPLDTGTSEMQGLAKRFENTYILLRFKGGHWKSCPPSLAETAKLSDKEPRILQNVHMHKLRPEELQPLLTAMHGTDSDCNFWFTN